MTTNPVSFYINRKGKAHGPWSLEELRTCLAYGSIKPDELVAEAGTDHWQPARQVFVTSAAEADAMPVEPAHGFLGWVTQTWQQWRHPATEDELKAALKTRRRVLRYRDWDKVPEGLRSTGVVRQMLVGFCFFPPSLWLACGRVFSSRVFRPVADEDGYLKIWPHAMQTVCTVVMVCNAGMWTAGVYGAVHYAGPMVSEASGAFMDSAKQFVQDSVNGAGR